MVRTSWWLHCLSWRHVVTISLQTCLQEAQQEFAERCNPKRRKIGLYLWYSDSSRTPENIFLLCNKIHLNLITIITYYILNIALYYLASYRFTNHQTSYSWNNNHFRLVLLLKIEKNILNSLECDEEQCKIAKPPP